jgi:hypothetical protein
MDGGYIAAGYTLSFGAGGDDFYIVKTDANGNQEWFKTYGGSASDVAYAIQVTADGGYIITGHTLSYGTGLHDVWLIRLETVIRVELVSFTSVVNNNSVVLEWVTASEINNLGFEIEKSQKSSRQDRDKSQNWERIAFISGYGTTTETQFYFFIDENVKPGLYSYRLKQIDFDGIFEFSNEIEVEVFAPNEFSLEQNYPNPFNPTTIIKYSIPMEERVTLKIYNSLGEEAATLIDEIKQAGYYQTIFDAANLASGVYFYLIQAGNFLMVKKMIITK